MKKVTDLWKILFDFFRLKGQPWYVKFIFRLYIFVAVFAPFIANDEPLVMSQNGNLTFPALQSKPYVTLNIKGREQSVSLKTIDWKTIQADLIIFAPVPYDPVSSDLTNYNYVSPFDKQFVEDLNNSSLKKSLPLRFRHWLGTNKAGADVLAGLIYSTRLSLLIGFVSMLIATFMGIILGALAGYFGDEGIQLRTKSFIISLALIVPASYYIFIFPEYYIAPIHKQNVPGYLIFLKIIIFILILILPFILQSKSKLRTNRSAGLTLPLDSIISRFIELFLSVPRLILIITLAAISEPSVLSLILILGFTSWTGIARIVRAEFIKLRNSGFADATSSLGYSPLRKIIYHLLPNAFITIRVGIIFGIAEAILAEAGLSFLGIGLAPDTVSWGSLLATGREQFSAWWLIVFPGMAISILLLILNKLADDRKQVPLDKLI